MWIVSECRAIPVFSLLAMKHPAAKPQDLTLVQRFVVGLFGLGFIASGIINVVRGRLHYLTYWHAPVLLPSNLDSQGLVF
jgi:hypothetical protein